MNTAFNTRSCRRCSQKKIRCDKAQPCASCIKSASECVFPGPDRAPRRKKQPLKAQLVSRLKSLEKEVQNLTEKLETVNHNSRRHPQPAEKSSAVNGERGKLFVDRGSSQYINHEVLVDLETQVGRLRKCGTCNTDRGPLAGRTRRSKTVSTASIALKKRRMSLKRKRCHQLAGSIKWYPAMDFYSSIRRLQFSYPTFTPTASSTLSYGTCSKRVLPR